MSVKKTDQQLKCTLKIVNNHVWTNHSLLSGVQSSAKRKKKLIKKHLHFQYKTKNGKRCVVSLLSSIGHYEDRLIISLQWNFTLYSNVKFTQRLFTAPLSIYNCVILQAFLVSHPKDLARLGIS